MTWGHGQHLQIPCAALVHLDVGSISRRGSMKSSTLARLIEQMGTGCQSSVQLFFYLPFSLWLRETFLLKAFRGHHWPAWDGTLPSLRRRSAMYPCMVPATRSWVAAGLPAL